MEPITRVKLGALLAIPQGDPAAFWSRVKRWFLVAGLVGLLVGLFVTGLEATVAYVWSLTSPHLYGIWVVIIPTVGCLASGLILQYATVNPEIHGTEEVIETFHERGGVFRFRSFPGKVLAAVATLGFGGAAGLEGPSIYVGGAIGGFALRKMRPLGFTDEDVRTLMVAGAAAGVAAIFKAPLTGIIFALEVPYRDDLTREALIPSLISSVVSYTVLVRFMGVEPLFEVGQRYTLSLQDLLVSAVLGAVVGFVARAFIGSFHFFGGISRRSGLPLWARTGIGGAVTGLLGLASVALLGGPAVLGVGYDQILLLMGSHYTTTEATVLLFLKTGAIVATLAGGAAGGVFIPMIMLGANTGTILRDLIPGATGPLFPVVGMAAFLAAGYNTPIAAAVFVAETTGGAGYIIPGLVASAVAFVVAGRTSVSDKQRWRRETRMDRLMKTRVADIMTRDVIALRSDERVYDFVTERIVDLRHKSMPVVDAEGLLVGVIGLSDVRTVPRERWTELTLADLMTRDARTVTAETTLGEVSALMSEHDIDRVPVVDPNDPRRLVGIVSSTDVLAVADMSGYRRGRTHQGGD